MRFWAKIIQIIRVKEYFQPDMTVHTVILVLGGGECSRVQGHSWLCNEFKASLGYIKLSLLSPCFLKSTFRQNNFKVITSYTICIVYWSKIFSNTSWGLDMQAHSCDSTLGRLSQDHRYEVSLCYRVKHYLKQHKPLWRSSTKKLQAYISYLLWIL